MKYKIYDLYQYIMYFFLLREQLETHLHQVMIDMSIAYGGPQYFQQECLGHDKFNFIKSILKRRKFRPNLV